MSLLLLFHPGISGSTGVAPPTPLPIDATSIPGDAGGYAWNQQAMWRRRRLMEDDEDLLAMLASVFPLLRR